MGDADSDLPFNDFDAIADVYDELVSWAPYDLWVVELAKRLRRWGLRAGDWILDAACGTGLSTLPWLERGYNVVGADVSEPMLERARARLRQEGCRAELKQQDLLQLDAGRQFDAAIVMHSGLDYILEPDRLQEAFLSLRRCVRPGGLLAFDKCLDEPSFYRDDYSESRKLSCGSVSFEYRWDRSRGVMEQRCTVFRDSGPEPRRSAVIFWLKAVPVENLIGMAVKAGFTMLEAPKQFTVTDPGMGIFRAF